MNLYTDNRTSQFVEWLVAVGNRAGLLSLGYTFILEAIGEQ